MFDEVKTLLSFETLLHFIYPEKCRFCNASIKIQKIGQAPKTIKNHFFCRDCWEKARPIAHPLCPICSAPFKSVAALSSAPNHLCGDCRKDPPYFLRAITPYPYEGVLAKAVQLLKYQQQPQLAKNLAHLLIEPLSSLQIDWVAPIPLHLRKLRSREFNQSLLIAKEVSRSLGWPLKLDLILRTRETGAQVGLSKKERKKNLARAFSVNPKNDVSGRRILLIDDVYTTGATLKEGAKTLVKAGAKEVIVASPTRMVLA